MIDQLNETHDSSRRSWVPTAQSHPIFPLQNLALGSAARVALRKRLCALLAEDSTERAQAQKLATKLLHKAAECELSANTFPTATSTWCATWGGTRTPCVNMT